MIVNDGLESCPFCGKKVTINRLSDEDGSWFYIHGIDRSSAYCNCRLFMESERFNKYSTDEAIKDIHKRLIDRWNRRAL